MVAFEATKALHGVPRRDDNVDGDVLFDCALRACSHCSASRQWVGCSSSDRVVASEATGCMLHGGVGLATVQPPCAVWAVRLLRCTAQQTCSTRLAPFTTRSSEKRRPRRGEAFLVNPFIEGQGAPLPLKPL